MECNLWLINKYAHDLPILDKDGALKGNSFALRL